jgi:hypothetical protein
VPQDPQLVGSVEVSTQIDMHAVNPESQIVAQMPLMHAADEFHA